MVAQEVVERLRSDPDEAEDADGLSEGVSLAVQFTRIMSLFAKGKHIRPQTLHHEVVDLWFLGCSHSSTRATQIAIADLWLSC